MDLEDTNTMRYKHKHTKDKQTDREQIIDRAQRGGDGSQQEAKTGRSLLPDRRTVRSVSYSHKNLLPFILQHSVLPVNP